MRRRHHERADRVQLAQHQLERRLAALGRNGLQPMLCLGDAGQAGGDDNQQSKTVTEASAHVSA